MEEGGGEEGVVLWTGTGAVIMYAKGSALAGAVLIIAAGFLVAVSIHRVCPLSLPTTCVRPCQFY